MSQVLPAIQAGSTLTLLSRFDASGALDIIGTESYLHTTPELLDLAGSRLRRRYKHTTSEDDSV